MGICFQLLAVTNNVATNMLVHDCWWTFVYISLEYISRKELLDLVICIGPTLINKYQSQYNNLIININKSFHDRFIIIDNKNLYHCGASFKDLGKKCFAINKIDNKDMLNELKSKIKR